MEIDDPSLLGGSPLWYVAHTKPRQEEVARRNLDRQRYEVYLPRLRVRKQIRGNWQVRLEPLFPSYVFFRTSRAEQSLAPVSSTQGVACIVRFGGAPAAMQPDTLQAIRELECRQNSSERGVINGLRPGKAVMITGGPLDGLEGLVAMVSSQRVTVLLDLLGARTPVRMSPDQLRVVG